MYLKSFFIFALVYLKLLISLLLLKKPAYIKMRINFLIDSSNYLLRFLQTIWFYGKKIENHEHAQSKCLKALSKMFSWLYEYF